MQEQAYRREPVSWVARPNERRHHSARSKKPVTWDIKCFRRVGLQIADGPSAEERASGKRRRRKGVSFGAQGEVEALASARFIFGAMYETRRSEGHDECKEE